MTPLVFLKASGPTTALGSPKPGIVVGEPRLITQSSSWRAPIEHPHRVLVGA